MGGGGRKSFSRTDPNNSYFTPHPYGLYANEVIHNISDVSNSKKFFINIDECIPKSSHVYSEDEAFSNLIRESGFHTNTSTSIHMKLLLEKIKEASKGREELHMICQDGKSVAFPKLLLCSAWPTLCAIINDSLCCSHHSVGDDIVLHVPCSHSTALLFKKFVMAHKMPYFTSNEKRIVLKFIQDFSFLTRQFSSDVAEDEELEDINSDDERDLFGEIRLYCPRAMSVVSSTGQNMCSVNCQHNCCSIDEDKKKQVELLFNDESLNTRKTKLLNHIIGQRNVGSRTDEFFILGHVFCTKYLSFLINTSEYVLKNILTDYASGVRIYHHGNRGILKQMTNSTENFVAWFQCFLETNGNYAPDEDLIVLPYWMKGKALYSMYKEDAPLPHIALSTFYEHLKTYFGPKRVNCQLPCVRFSPYSSHSVCDICVVLNKNLRLCVNEVEIEQARALKNQHKIDFSSARKSIERLKQLALSYPEDHLFIQCDGEC